MRDGESPGGTVLRFCIELGEGTRELGCIKSYAAVSLLEVHDDNRCGDTADFDGFSYIPLCRFRKTFQSVIRLISNV
jgi:hypothetical protein